MHTRFLRVFQYLKFSKLNESLKLRKINFRNCKLHVFVIIKECKTEYHYTLTLTVVFKL